MVALTSTAFNDQARMIAAYIGGSFACLDTEPMRIRLRAPAEACWGWFREEGLRGVVPKEGKKPPFASLPLPLSLRLVRWGMQFDAVFDGAMAILEMSPQPDDGLADEIILRWNLPLL